MSAPLSPDEAALLNHWSMWGASGYPIQKRGRSWWWTEWRGVKGCPAPFKTKREAEEAFERFISILIDRKAGRI